MTNYRRVDDWNDAYANGPNIAGGERWPDAWVEPAQAFRDRLAAKGRAHLDQAYGEGARNRYDLFMPEGEAAGLVVFVHGGFWLRLDKNFWSHLAAGAVESGYAVAMPSYTLCPQIRIAGIVEEVGVAIAHAAGRIQGPVMLAGHSAGGHLVSRMVSATSPLAPTLRARIRNVVSISGVHDLRPIMRTAMNADLKMDAEEARAQSPALLDPMPGARVCCWVGGNERAEFLRQNALLANAWTGCGAETACVVEPDRHHFNVIDGLAEPGHALTRTLLTA